MERLSREPSDDGAGAFVGSVERELEEWLAEERRREAAENVMAAAAGHLTLAPAAKRARPTLVYHFGTAAGVDPDRLRDPAVAAELVHTASLLHDDVVDRGWERRNRPTVNVEWDNLTAVLTGDALLCRALEVLEPYPRELTTTAVETVAEMTRALMLEAHLRQTTEVDRRDWERVASGKTAALFGWCGGAPAHVGECGDLVERFERAGRHLGLAFQLADDLKDVVDVDDTKDSYADLRNGDISHPVVCAIDDDPDVAAALEGIWSGSPGAPSPAETADLIRQTEGPDRTCERIAEEVESARSALDDTADRRGGREITNWGERLVEAVEGWLTPTVARQAHEA